MKEKIDKLQQELNSIYESLGMFMYKNEMTFSSYHIAKPLGQLPDTVHTMLTKNKTTQDKIHYLEVINLKNNSALLNCLIVKPVSSRVPRELSASDVNRKGKASSNLYLFDRSQARLLVSFSSTQHGDAVNLKIKINNSFDLLEELLQTLTSNNLVINDNMTIVNIKAFYNTMDFRDFLDSVLEWTDMDGAVLYNALYKTFFNKTAFELIKEVLKDSREVPEFEQSDNIHGYRNSLLSVKQHITQSFLDTLEKTNVDPLIMLLQTNPPQSKRERLFKRCLGDIAFIEDREEHSYDKVRSILSIKQYLEQNCRNNTILSDRDIECINEL